MPDYFPEGVRSITSVLLPRFPGWREAPVDKHLLELGGVVRAFLHERNCVAVFSAVEYPYDGRHDKGPEYHLSISRQTPSGPRRCNSDTARWVLKQFGLADAEEDNHVPYGVARNFWRPVSDRFTGLVCDCKAEEPAVVEDKGDFIWRAAP